jgi:polysaccharide export outer membrane protein
MKDFQAHFEAISMITNRNHLVHQFRLMKLSPLLFTALFALAGCETNQFNDASSKIASQQQPHLDTIILREGDAVRVAIPDSPNLDTTQSIRRDGRIALPLVGDVVAVGITADELQQKLIKLYSSQISSKELTVTVISSSIPIFVTGSVRGPGKFAFDHPVRPLEAIMEAGGFAPNADAKDVKVMRSNKEGRVEIYHFDLKRVMQGKEAETFYLKPFDIINVPEKFNWF